MLRLKYYAIRQKSTGYFLPMPSPDKVVGFTSVKPLDFNHPKIQTDFQVRLYITKKAASISLGYWLKGVHTAKYKQMGTGPDTDVWVDIEIDKNTARDPDDFEVVPVILRNCN